MKNFRDLIKYPMVVNAPKYISSHSYKIRGRTVFYYTVVIYKESVK